MSNWRWLAAPLAALYGGIIGIRHVLYDEHMLPKYEPQIPTIGVGNLAMGGTGKTPVVEYLIRLLEAHHFTVGVLSRGYKRRTHGFIQADEHATADSIGDEAMQIHCKFPNVSVYVCEDRASAIRKIQKANNHPDVILLDDAYQHRAIVCGMNILLTTYDRLYVHDHLVPWGTLRDIPYRATKANIIVVTKCPDSLRPIDKRVVDNSLHPATFQHLYFSHMLYEHIPFTGVPLLLTAIARPEYMIEHIRAIQPQTEVLTYPDHHRFSAQDVKTILQRAEQCDCIITTEKDMQRLRQTDLLEQYNKPVIVQPITITVDKEAHSFDEDILAYVRESLHKREQKTAAIKD